MIYVNINPNANIHDDKLCVLLQITDEKGGNEISYDIKSNIIKLIESNGLSRNFAISGQEPLSEENRDFILSIVSAVKVAYPSVKIYLWTEYNIEDLLINYNDVVLSILEKVDVLIDGPFDKTKIVSEPLRKSSNQNIYRKQPNGHFIIDNSEKI